MMTFSRCKIALSAALWLLTCGVASGSDYDYPILDVRGRHSASFGEMRPNHFHSGIDIKTEGKQGKPIVAAADGYISRVLYSPYGYGLALYVVHPALGTMTVYGHLSRFRADVADYVRAEQYAQRRSRVDLTLEANIFPVRRGEVIGYSGNSGSSFGPHLHFELRTADGEQTLNVVRRGLCAPQDDIAPQLLLLDYIDTDTLDGVSVERLRRSYALEKRGSEYVIDGEVEVGRCGYFVLSCRDRQNGTSNRYGIYRVSVRLDDSPIFEYRMDGFRFDDTRACNVVSYYQLQRIARCEVLRLAKIGPCVDAYSTASAQRGVVAAEPNEQRRVEIEVEDDCGNVSVARFVVRGRENDSLLPATESLRPPHSLVGGAAKDISVACRGARLGVPAWSLYEPTFCSVAKMGAVGETIEGVEVLSPEYNVLSADVPLRGSVGVHIEADVPLELMSRVCVACRNAKGKWRYAGGYYVAGGGTMLAKSCGAMAVVADVAAPQITPLFESGADMRKSGSLRFRVSDNFSDIDTYELRVDGKWCAVDFRSMTGEMVYAFDEMLTATGQRHEVELRVTDCCGNIALWRGEIVR